MKKNQASSNQQASRNGDGTTRRRLLLLSLESYSCSSAGGASSADNPLRIESILCTTGFVYCFLLSVEHALRWILVSIQHLHPLLQDETKRNIIARHVGVDALSCFVVAHLGWKARRILSQELAVSAKKKDDDSRPSSAGALFPWKNSYSYNDRRLFQYYPEAARLLVFFLAFQFKNLADTIYWNDGPEYIAHHVMAILSSGGGLIPGAFHFYGVFYMGISEASTGILCLLVNFDDEHGVPGLADAFPLGKIVLGGLFAVSFVVVRIFLWGTLTYYYYRDLYVAFQESHPKLNNGSKKRVYAYLNSISLGLVTLLQIIWLFEIFRAAKTELLN